MEYIFIWSDKVNKCKMYNYDYIAQLTIMYNAKVFGLIQIKDIKKNSDYYIKLQQCVELGVKHLNHRSEYFEFYKHLYLIRVPSIRDKQKEKSYLNW